MPSRSRAPAVLVLLVAATSAALVWLLWPGPEAGPGPRGASPSPERSVREPPGTEGDAPGRRADEPQDAARRAIASEAGGETERSEPVAGGEDCRLAFVVRTVGGTAVETGRLELGHELEGETRWLEESVRDGRVELLVPAGARLVGVSVQPVEREVPQLEWTAGEVRTSGFVEWDASETWFEDESFEPTIRGDRSFEIVVETGLVVSGKVLDASTGRGIEGAWALVADGFDSVGVRSGSDGSFTVRGRSPLDPDFDDELVVSAVHPSYRATRIELPVAGSGDRVTEIELRMEPGVHLAGTVVDAQGAAVPGAEVRLMVDRVLGEAFDELGSSWSVRADEQGRFAFWGATPSDRAELHVFDGRGSHASFVYGPFALRTDLAGLVVAMPRPAMLQLRVLRSDGAPVKTEECFAILSVDGEAVRTIRQLGRSVAVPLHRRVGWTILRPDREETLFARGEDRFAQSGLHERDVVLRVLDPSTDLPPRGERILGPDEEVSSSSMNVDSRYVAHDYVAELVDEDGAPLANQLARFHFAHGAGSMMLNDRGHAQLTLPPGAQWCRVEVDGFVPRHLRVRVPIGGRSLLPVALERAAAR